MDLNLYSPYTPSWRGQGQLTFTLPLAIDQYTGREKCATAVGTYGYRRAPNAEIAGNEQICGENLSCHRYTFTLQALAKSSYQIATMTSPIRHNVTAGCNSSVGTVSRLNAGSQVIALRLPPQAQHFAFSETSRQGVFIGRGKTTGA